MTRPGGRILVWDHNPRNPYWRMLMARVPQDTGEERLIPEDELLDGLGAAGARIAALELSSDLFPTSCRERPSAPRPARSGPWSAPRSPRRLCAHNVILAEPTGPRTP